MRLSFGDCSFRNVSDFFTIFEEEYPDMRYDRYEDLIGKKLLHNVISAKGMMLIPVDTLLTEGHIEKLQNFQIDLFDIRAVPVEPKEDSRLVWKEDQPAAELAKQAAEVRPAADNTVEFVKRADAKMQEIEKCVLHTGTIPVSEMESNLLPAIMGATQNRNIYKLFAELKAEGDFRFKHSIGTAFIAAMLGRWLQLEEKEVSTLAMAASLCDIGTVKLPSALLNKTTELAPHEFEIMKQHTVIGYELLKESELDPRVALVALQHHEREDGSGYPSKLKSADIHLFSKIVALADVYLTMTTDRPGCPALPFYEVIQKLHADILQNRFDSKIGMTFLNRLMSAQVGSEIILTDERRGKIVLINANYPTSPLVSLDTEFIDLSKTSALKIKEIVG
ncbi:HD-GYP domain-containing protein [Paenibacillus sp. GCM10012303]